MRKYLRIARRVFVGLLAGFVLLMAAAAIALQFKPVRGLVRDQALAALRGSLKGQLFVDDVRWPRPSHLELTGVVLRDRHDVRVAEISSLQLDLQLSALWSGKLVARRLEVDHLYVDLADLSSSAGLLSVFESDTPSPPSDPDADLSPIAIVVKQLCIAEGELRIAPDVQRKLALRHLHTCVRFGIARELSVEVPRLRAELDNDGVAVLRLLEQKALPPLAAADVAPTVAPSAPAPGAPTLASVSGKLRFRTSRDLAFDVQLPVRSFASETLRALGVDVSVLRAPLDADITAHAKAGRIDYRVDLRGSGNAAAISGQWTPELVLWAHLSTDKLELTKLTTLELPPLSAELDARLDVSKSDALELQLNLVRGQFGALELPETLARATFLSDGAIELRNFDARYAAAQLSGHGRIGAAGGIQLSATFDVADLATLPPLQTLQLSAAGAGSGSIELEQSGTTLDAKLELELREARFETSTARHVQLNAEAHGALLKPDVQAQLTLQDVHAAGEQIANASFELEGGPAGYKLRGRADTHALVLDAWLTPKQHCWDGGLSLDAELFAHPLHLAVALARFIPEQRIEVHELRAQYRDAKLFADGALGLAAQPSQLRAGLSVPDLAVFTQQFANSQLPGRIEAVASLQGKLEQPTAELRVSLKNGPALAGKPSRAELHVNADAKQGNAQANLDAHAGDAHAVAHWRGTWKRSLPLSAALTQLEHDLTLELGGVSIEGLAQTVDTGKAPLPLAGVISGQLHAHGTPQRIGLETEWKSRLHPAEDERSFDALVSAQYADHQLELDLKAGDRQGQMFSARFEQALDLEAMLQQPPDPKALIEKSRWQLAAELSPRRLRELPFVSGVGIDRSLAPLLAALQLQVKHEPGSEPEGKLETKLNWRPELLRNASGNVTGKNLTDSVESGCSERARGELNLTAKLAAGSIDVELVGGTSAPDSLRVQTGLRATLAELLGGQNNFALGPKRLTVQVRELDLANLPVLCEHAAGVVSTKLTATDLFDKLVKLQLEVKGQGLQWDESPAFAAAISGKAEGDDLVLDTRLDSGKGTAQINGRLPIGFRVGDPALCVNRAGGVALKGQFKQLSLASLLAFVPGVARVSGTIDGAVDVSGSLEAPTARGSVQLDDVSLTLPRLGQRFSHAYLKAVLNGRNLRLEHGKVRDLDGSATLAAQLSFNDVNAWTAALNANARNFPLRKSGVMLGRFDADAKITAHTTREQTEVSVKLANVSVTLTTQDMGAVQSLEPHAEIVFSDAAVEVEPDEEDVAQDKPSGRARIEIITTEPLWIRRDDFAVQMETELYIALGGENPELTGKVKLLRGYISLLGQSFDIKSGQVTFAGGGRVDPRLEISALHSGHTGHTVRLEVTGFVQKPELMFYVDEQRVTAGEAVIAMTGRSGDQGSSPDSAQKQLASAAIGMTTGLLSLGARREFGDFIPMLAIEQGDQTRVRVGLEADRLIPHFMRSFVRGAYVEGIISSEDTSGGQSSNRSSNNSNTASGGGVMLELMLPSDIVWAGQYGPGLWSVDFAWRP